MEVKCSISFLKNMFCMAITYMPSVSAKQQTEIVLNLKEILHDHFLRKRYKIKSDFVSSLRMRMRKMFKCCVAFLTQIVLNCSHPGQGIQFQVEGHSKKIATCFSNMDVIVQVFTQ